MDTENSFLSSRVLLTTGIIISTLLLCVVASDFHAFMPAGSPPNQQALSQRQQNRFAEFYPGRSSGTSGTTAASAPRVTSTISTTPVIPVSQSTAVTSENSVTATEEQFYTPDISGSVSGAENQSPVNVTINSDLAPQLASLNARLDELSKQLAEKNSNEPTERVFEYRIEEETTAKAAQTDRKVPQHNVVVASASSVTENTPSVTGPSQFPSPVQPAAPAPQVVPQFAPQPVPVSQPAPVPQVIVVTQPVYPWGMPPVATPLVFPTPMSTPAQHPAAVSHSPAPRNETPAEPAWEKAEHHVHENNGVLNVFPLNLQMSLNIAPPDKGAETGAKTTEESEPEFTFEERQTDARPASVHKQKAEQQQEGPKLAAQQQEVPKRAVPSEDHFAEKVVSDFEAVPKPDVSPAAAEVVPESKATAISTNAQETAELFMPFEPIEPEPAPKPVAAPSKPPAPVTTPQPKETAVAIIMNPTPMKPAAVKPEPTAQVSEDDVPVLEPIIDPSVEPASATKTAESVPFAPEPKASETDATSSQKVVPFPEPDPMFQTPSAVSGLPPQALMTVPAAPEPFPAPFNPAPAGTSTSSTSPIVEEPFPQPQTAPPMMMTPGVDTSVPQSWSFYESVPAAGSEKAHRSAPEKAGKRSRLSAVREAFSEAGEEVRERFDSVTRPSFDLPNWMEKLGSDSPTSESMAPGSFQAPVQSNPGASNAAGPRRFHDAQNATGKPGQAMVQGHPSAVARREPNRPVNLPTGSPRPASASQTVMRTSGQSPVYMPTQPNVQPARVMTFNGPGVSRPSMPVPQFDTPDWIEDPPVQWPSPPVSQTAHRLSSALRFAGQPKVVR
ncbi:MAG: hypothetical protein U0996_07240 [Planctomycetaceae bacterium]